MIPPALRQRLAGTDRVLIAPEGTLEMPALAGLGPEGGLGAEDTVLVSLAGTRALIRVLAALDGAVAGLLLVSASLPPETVDALGRIAGATRVISDRDDLPGALTPDAAVAEGAGAASPLVETRWMMTTSGTTGIPKIVPHSLASLARTVRRDPQGRAPVWGLVLEPTRFAGMQVVLQALLGGGMLAAAPRAAPAAEQIAFLAAAGGTHLSATPTLWRRLLMAPGLAALPLRQVTMGGEIADQAVLDAVAARFPQARLTHIYASTEAGVGFAVNDRLAGFPLSYCDSAPGGVGVAVRDGLLWLRPPDGRRIRYLGGQDITVDEAGYVLTGDQIEITDGRAYFLGRDSGVVNVGGVKVHPERVEREIAAVPGVALAAVAARRNPITGALLVATVVPSDLQADPAALKAAILTHCRDRLEREAVPARVLFAETLETNAAGKIVRS